MTITFDVSTHLVTLPPGWIIFPWGQFIIDEVNRRVAAPAPWKAAPETVVVVTPPPPPPPPPPDPSTALYKAINSARIANGRPMLTLDPAVSSEVSAWVAQNAATGMSSHGNFPMRIAGVRPGKAAGEDLGEGYTSGAAEVQGWLGDAAHRSVLLGNWTSVGVGVATGANGSLYWGADFIAG